MAQYLAALDRPVGKVDTDSNGLARYSFKLELPPAQGHNNVPELSLEYCQGTPNGSLGLGWALGGVSCIRTAASNLAYDGINTLPVNFDPAKPKLTLDGAELLNVKGEYWEPGTEYATEIDSLGITVSHFQAGFVVRDSSGVSREYGTSEDSRVQTMDGNQVREWYIKKRSDYYGNTIIYNYVTSPQGNDIEANVRTCYLSDVRYGANDRAGKVPTRIVRFDYSPRTDKVVQIVQGDKVIWASILTAVRIGLIQNNGVQISRSYELAYTTSPSTSDSCLTSITETSNDGKEKLLLIPSEFGYTSPGVASDNFFKAGSQKVTNLRSTTNNVAILQTNVSGRCLTDLACVRADPITNAMSIKTYIATREFDGTVSWTPSRGPGAEATLPVIDTSRGSPSILMPDTNNDGRSDLIIPYCDGDGMLRFSMSQSIGTGFTNYRTKRTSFQWTDDSKFLAVDLTGRGTTDVVQIFTDRRKLCFRNFTSVILNNELGLQNAQITRTSYENVGTVEWFVLTHAKTGAMSLIRIWIQDQGNGTARILATTFAAAGPRDSPTGFQETQTSVLETSVRINQAKNSVVTCDINADGTQDIVLVSADYRDRKMTIKYTVYLGDGLGGFQRHKDTMAKDVEAPVPLQVEGGGTFHTTNLNGSNYPSICYVYQGRDSKSFVCLSVDGNCAGTVSEITRYQLGSLTPSTKWEIVPADLNGNGIGDWLFFTLDGDQPRVAPVYNQANVTDFLAWARDSKGLRTELTYGPLSDPAVYTPPAPWDSYSGASNDYYTLLGAPNYVVRGLVHSNDISINSLDYRVSIKKCYYSAILNTKGRGWQGFERINTFNMTGNVQMTEYYYHDWPLTSQKSQIDTKTSDGKVLRSDKILLESIYTQRGPWKIYHTNKTLEQADMWEGDVVARSNATSYGYDNFGNILSQCCSESVRGVILSKRWQRNTYTSINGITGLITSKKESSSEININASTFENGDVSLTLYGYDSQTALLKSISEWSKGNNAFSVKSFLFDQYGNEIQTIDAAGLKTTTTYDQAYQSFPVKIVSEGPGFSAVELAGFDQASGQEVIKLDDSGVLTCYYRDTFGRLIETRKRSVEPGNDVKSAIEFYAQCPYVADLSLTTIMRTSYLHPYRSLSFEWYNLASGSRLLGTKVISYSKSGIAGRNEVLELVDCVNQVRMRHNTQADDDEKVCMFWEYDSCGRRTFEAFPHKIPTTSALDSKAPDAKGLRIEYDILGRQTAQIRPAHGDGKHFLVTSTEYLDGGASMKERNLTASTGQTPLQNSTQLAILTKRYVRIDEQDLLAGIINENGLKSTFQYDDAGNMVIATDPSGVIERLTYDTKGQLKSRDNVVQTTGTSPDAGITYQYDKANFLVSEDNAIGERITYKRDARGRLLQKLGNDGRAVVYTYGFEGNVKPSSIAVYPRGVLSPLESKIDFAYDHQGRVVERKLTVEDGTSFATTLAYDRQGEVVQKTFQDGAILTNDYRGNLLASTSLSGGPASTWLLKGEFVKYTATESPEQITLQGTDVKDKFEHNWTYDSQAAPISHRLSSGNSTLVQQHYLYNDLDQIVRKTDFLSGSTTDYSYDGRRLQASQSANGTKLTYEYDSSGNLTRKGDINISKSLGRVIGTTNNLPLFDVQYDAAGRMVKRMTMNSSLDFVYDSFGSLKSYTNSKSRATVQIGTDFEGDTLQRRHSNGQSDLLVDFDYSIHTLSDGSRIIRHKLFGKGYLLGSVSNTYQSSISTRPLGQGSRVLNVPYTDTKGSITHVFNGSDATLREKFDFDDYGQPGNEPSAQVEKDTTASYEGNRYEEDVGLMDFGGRWYDPLVGRFTTADDVTDVNLLMKTDGLNRYAFENNDPINHTDPTGHWSWSSIFGVILGAILVVAAIATTVLTGGAAGVLAAAAVGAMAGGGIAGIKYSIDHKDEDDAGKFWGGFGVTVVINAAIGAASGALGAVATPARSVAATGRLLSKIGVGATSKLIPFMGKAMSVGGMALVGGAMSVLTAATDRAVSNVFYGTNDDIFGDWGTNFGVGAAVGGAVGLFGLGQGAAKWSNPMNKLLGINKFDGAFKLRSYSGLKAILAPRPSQPWNISWGYYVKETLIVTATKTAGLAWWGVKPAVVPQVTSWF